MSEAWDARIDLPGRGAPDTPGVGATRKGALFLVGDTAEQGAVDAARSPTDDAAWPQSDDAEIIRTARRLAPVDPPGGGGLAVASAQRKRRPYRLALSAVLAGCCLVSLLVGDALLRSLLRGAARETAAPVVAMLIPAVETRTTAREPVAAAPKPAILTLAAPDVAAPAPPPAEPAPTASASQSAELPATQAATEPEPAAASESGSTEPARSDIAAVDALPAAPTVELPPVAASENDTPEPPKPVFESPAASVDAPAPAGAATVPAVPANETLAALDPLAPAPIVDASPSATPAIMVQRGNDLLAAGDIISARRFFERAAASGNAAAACGVGKSYDPLFLRRIGARGVTGDAATAIVWYRRAAEAGDREAQERLQRLSGQRELSFQSKR